MNPSVLTQFAAPDPNAAPLTVVQLVELLNRLVSSEIQGSYIPYVIQNGTPGVEDQDKTWLELDSQGRPIAIKIYWHGHWRRVYNGMLGEIRGYQGNPATDFDTRGLGKVGLTYDGWHLCNGLDGAPDLSDKFVIGAHLNNADGHDGYDSGQWKTWLTGAGLHTGGAKDITLTDATTYRPARDAVTARRHSADGNAPDDTGTLLGIGSADTQYPLQGGGEEDAGNTEPDSISVVNPFIALGWIIFVGYST